MSGDVTHDGNSLEEALSIVRNSKIKMIQCLDNIKLMDGLKHASTMLTELRTSSLGPKQYYELYMSAFDALGYLSNYLSEAHKTGRHHLADLYELVQYAGNIVPRLYLMITVGSVYMAIDGSPVKEIMRDMMEMSRGVQHPIRGLFLRYYLSGQTRNSMPVGRDDGVVGNLQDSIQFTLTNFIEMNKLWVRLQHQGHSRERQMRELERTELKTLVGTNLVRLSQLDGIGLQTYSEVILPAVLEQVIQCRDILAQEYLLEVIIQVYPDDYHLRTLNQYLSAIAKLNPHVNITQIVIQLIDRLAEYAAREAEIEQPADGHDKKDPASASLAEKLEKLDTNGEVATDEQHQLEKRNEHNIIKESFRGVPADVKLFDVFWQQITKLVGARTDLKIQDISAMLVSLCKLTMNCYPTKLEYVDQILDYARKKTVEHKASTDLHSPEARENMQKLLLEPLSIYPDIMTILAIPAYLPLLEDQIYAVRRTAAATIADTLIQKQIKISSVDNAEGVFRMLQVLISESRQDNNHNADRRPKGAESEQTIEEQGWLARLIHSLHSDDLETQLKLLQVARNALSEGGERIKHTYPAIVLQSLKLARRWHSREHLADDWSQKCSVLYKFIHQTISSLFQRVGCSDVTFRLFVYAGQVADQGGFEETSYEFFAQAFTIYEEAISESKAQFQAVAIIISALQQTRSFTQDNYDTLVTKCALHGAKLLKKPDQTRAVLTASHLWWATDIPSRGEEDDKTLYRDDKRVLECLQKALKIADACMDTATSIQLFIEILNQYLYYFDRQNEAIVPKFVNGLIDLIKQNLENMDPTSIGQRPLALSTSALSEPEGSQFEYITNHFQRTLAHIETRKEEEDHEHWAEVN